MRSEHAAFVAHHLESARIRIDLEATDIQAIIERLVDDLIDAGQLPAEEREGTVRRVMEREREASTALGQGLAVPHARIPGLGDSRVAFARLKTALNLGAPDGRSVRFVALLLTGDHHEQHLEFLMGIARMMSDEVFVGDAFVAPDEEGLRHAIRAYFARVREPTSDVPPEDDYDEAFSRTGRFAGGLIRDITRRRPHFISDVKDGLHSKALAAAIFLFFACVAPAVAFGGLMAALTANEIGAIETLVATALGSIVYALFSGQPLTLIGATGPLLVFTVVLYDLCSTLTIPFLPTYAWVGLWTALFTALLALTDASALIRYCTRFTDEIFAVLISLIFIVQAIAKLQSNFTDSTVSEHSALLSVILAVGTLWIATNLRDFRRSRYLHPTVREFLADFGSTIAIATMVAVGAYFARPDMPVLSVPDTLRPTVDRPWLIDVMSVPSWVMVGSVVPALLCTVLVYLGQNITARLVNRRDNRLKKGPGYHLDLLVIAVLIGVCSMFGLPWLVAATVRSLNHVHALSTHEQSVTASGRVVDTVVYVRENRLTGVLIGAFIGFSLLAFPWAARHGIYIPTAVLLGLFLYMGINSLGRNQLWERVKLLAMEPAFYPQTHYVRRVPIQRIHLFTVIQLVGLTVLWLINESALAVLFPLVIALLVPLRMALGQVFSQEELDALDSEEEPEALDDTAQAGP